MRAMEPFLKLRLEKAALRSQSFSMLLYVFYPLVRNTVLYWACKDNHELCGREPCSVHSNIPGRSSPGPSRLPGCSHSGHGSTGLASWLPPLGKSVDESLEIKNRSGPKRRAEIPASLGLYGSLTSHTPNLTSHSTHFPATSYADLVTICHSFRLLKHVVFVT